MSSQIITPPDKIFSPYSYLVINALDKDVDLLVLWLKTVPEKYDIHLYHQLMKESDFWLLETIAQVKVVLVNYEYLEHMSYHARRQLDRRLNWSYFGKGTDYPDLVQFFIQNRQ